MTLIPLRFHDNTEEGRTAFVNPATVVLIEPAKFDIGDQTVGGSQIQFVNGTHRYVHGDPVDLAIDLDEGERRHGVEQLRASDGGA